MADDNTPNSAPADPVAALNKAQAEFQSYVKRVQAQQPGSIPVFMMPSPQRGGAMPGWAFPPSVAMLPQGPGQFGASVARDVAAVEGTLTHALGSTFRLGVDVLNAALAGSVRLLNGISGAAYPESECGDEGCGCHSGCESCREESCGHDCCCDPCCQPSVGRCC